MHIAATVLVRGRTHRGICAHGVDRVSCNTLSVNMQAEIFDSFAENCGYRPIQGWIARGSQITVCAVGNYFSFIENRDELLNDVMTIMRAKVGDVQDDLLVNLYARLGGDTKEALY